MTAAPSRGRLTALLLFLVAFGLLAMTLCLPSMPDWATVFGVSPAQVQLTFGGYLVSFGALQLLFGPLSDRHGRRPVVVAGLLLAAAGSAVAALAPNLPVLVAARVLQGAGAASALVIGRALVNDHFSGAERTRVMAWIGMAMGLCPPAGTLLGGQLHAHAGWRAGFVVLVLLALALAAAAWRWLAPQPARLPGDATAPAGMLSAYRRLAAEPGFALHVGIMGLTTGTFYVFLSSAPLVLAHAGVPPQSFGWYIAFVPLSYIVGNAVTSRVVRRHGDAAIMRAGQALNMLALAGVVALAWAGVAHPLAFVAPLTLMGVGHGLLLPPTLVRSVGMVPALAGAAAAVGGLMQQLTGAAGSLLAGLLPGQGAGPVGALMLAMTTLATLLVLRATRR